MSKRILSLALALILAAGAASAAEPNEPAEPVAGSEAPAAVEEPAGSAAPDAVEAEEPAGALESEFPVFLNGEAAELHSELEDGVTWVSPVRFALAADPRGEGEDDGEAAWAKGEGFSISARTGEPYIEINGRYFYVPGGLRRHGETGEALCPVRTLAGAFGLAVGWSRVGVTLEGEPSAPESGEEFYDPVELDLIARVIHHESGNQPLEGRIAVGNVILNRVASPLFPDTVAEVLAQKNQFPGATNATPSEQSILAAKLCLEGANTVGEAYWFNGVGRACWASRNKTLVKIIGDHAFYG